MPCGPASRRLTGGHEKKNIYDALAQVADSIAWMIVENGVEVTLQMGKVVPLWAHVFVARVKVLRVFRQLWIVRLQRLIDHDIVCLDPPRLSLGVV